MNLCVCLVFFSNFELKNMLWFVASKGAVLLSQMCWDFEQNRLPCETVLLILWFLLSAVCEPLLVNGSGVFGGVSGVCYLLFFPPLLHVLLMALCLTENRLSYICCYQGSLCRVVSEYDPQEPMFMLVMLYTVLKSLSIVRGKITVLCCCSVNQMLVSHSHFPKFLIPVLNQD